MTNEKVCLKCGTLNPQDATFCRNCGKRFGVEYASLGQRIGAYLLDLIILVIIVILLVGLYSYSIGYSYGYSIGWVIGFLVRYAYFIFLEAVCKGQTLGKMAASIRVVDKDTGEAIGWKQSLIRNILRIIDIDLTLGLGIIGIILIARSDENQRLGDSAANTIVIKEE